jgi:cytochrome c oxidase cbb3-type subunit I
MAESANTATPPAAQAVVTPGPVRFPLVNNRLVKYHLAAAIFWFTIALFAGLLYATQFLQHYEGGTSPWMSPGRVRMVHTNLIAFAFLTNGFLGMLYWCVPRLTGQRVLSDLLGWLIFWVWQALMLALWVGLHMGEAQAVEWGETPVWLDPLIVVGAVLVSIQFYTPIIRSKERAMYVSLWYFSAAFIWLGLTYIMGNFFPQYVVPGTAAGALLGLYIHDLVGLWVTPMGWGLMYFFVPVILKKPIWSHALSLVGFWGLAFFYPLQGVHHFLWSPIPMFAQYGAVISTIAVEIVVTTVIINFFMTWRGSESTLRTNMAIRWFWVGALFYFITCLQCAFQVTLTFQTIIHFTDWVVGHAHLVMFGVFSFWLYGVLIHLWPKLTGREWWSRKLNAWHFWLTAVGLGAMFLDLMTAGLIQGYLWRALSPWEDSLRASYPFWLTRAFLGIAIITGHILLVINMWKTARAPAPNHLDRDYIGYEQAEEPAEAMAGASA